MAFAGILGRAAGLGRSAMSAAKPLLPWAGAGAVMGGYMGADNGFGGFMGGAFGGALAGAAMGRYGARLNLGMASGLNRFGKWGMGTGFGQRRLPSQAFGFMGSSVPGWMVSSGIGTNRKGHLALAALGMAAGSQIGTSVLGSNQAI